MLKDDKDFIYFVKFKYRFKQDIPCTCTAYVCNAHVMLFNLFIIISCLKCFIKRKSK